MQEALELKRISLGKVWLWMEATNLSVPYLSRISCLDCDRKAVGRLVRLLEQASEGAGSEAAERPAVAKSSGRQRVGGNEGGREGRGGSKSAGREGAVAALAVALCRHEELVSEHVEERMGAVGETPMMREAAAGNARRVKLLILAGGDPDAQSRRGRTAMMLASQCGRVEAMQVLIRVGQADVQLKDEEGRSSIFYAAGNGHTEAVRILLGSRADVNAQSNSRWTPLIAAANDGFLDTVRVLVKEGSADVNFADTGGWSALFYAALNGHAGVVTFLLTEGSVAVDARDSKQRTALMIAARNGHRRVVETLLKTGKADVNARAEKGWTAVKAARRAGKKEVLDWLLKVGGAVEVENEEGDEMMYFNF